MLAWRRNAEVETERPGPRGWQQRADDKAAVTMSNVLSQIEACVPALRRYAVGLLRSRDEADDLVHDCLVRALDAHVRSSEPFRSKIAAKSAAPGAWSSSSILAVRGPITSR